MAIIHKVQKNNWSCILTCFAMILGVEEEEIINFVGHDGSEVLFPELKEPQRRRGFHVQEMIDFCLSKNKTITEINKNCIQGPLIPDNVDVSKCVDYVYFLKTVCGKKLDDRINHYMNHYSGVLYGSLISDQ